jgi:glutamate-1-semialdehyde 2,1-aminomutase
VTDTAREFHERSRAIGYSLSGAFYLPPDQTVVIDHGDGASVIDTNGRRYIDYLSGSGAVLLGHGNPEIAAAISAQALKGTHFYMLNEPAIQLGEKLVEIIACAEEVKFLPSGSEASLHAMRMCRAFTGKSKIMKFEGSFHGTNDYAMMSGWTPSKGYPRPNPDSLGIPKEIEDLIYVVPWNNLEMTEHYLRKHAHETAALICEAVQRTVPPEPGFLEAIRKLTQELGILLVFDEMVTGFRLSLGGAQKYYGVTPDMAIFGKAMTNGLPMTTLLGRSDVIAYSRPAEARGSNPGVFYGGTLNGNPLCASAALAAIGIMERPGTYERLTSIVNRLKEGIRASGARYGVPVQVVGPDNYFQVFFSETKITSFLDQQNSNTKRGKLFFAECFKRGVLMNTNARCYVSMVLTDEDMETSLSVMDDAIAVIAHET